MKLIVPIRLFLAVILLTACAQKNEKHADAHSLAADTCTVDGPHNILYGIDVDNMTLEAHRMRRGDNIGGILLRAGLSQRQKEAITSKIADVYDFRLMRRGNGYRIFYTTDTTQTPQYFVYLIDDRQYLRVKLTEPYAAEVVNHEVRTLRCEREVTINNNLWTACTEAGMPYELPLALSDIYAWSIDFFGIEKGDRVKVIYDEDWVDSVRIGLSGIVAAKFIHKGNPFFAIAFTDDSIKSYYDLNGNSLRRAFLKAPLSYSRISSRFSRGRMHPILKIRRPHNGVDYAAPSGTPVVSIGDGTVIAKGFDNKGGGNYVKVRHNSVYTTVYMHLRGFARDVRRGGQVRQGQVIGFVGSTGMSTGPHLDFRVYKGGAPIDPLSMDAPPVEPVSNDNMEAFMELAEKLLPKLECML